MCIRDSRKIVRSHLPDPGRLKELLIPGVEVLLRPESNQIKRKTKYILDIGSGSGFFLKRAKERGWIAHGIEPNVIASNYSRKIGVPVVNDFFQNVDIKNMQKYDVINLVAVLEHVDNPIELLKRCYLLL